MAVIQQKDKNKWTKDGRSWYFDTYYTKDNGKKDEKRSKYYKTKKEAKDAEKEFLNKVENQHTNNEKKTLHKIINEWLPWKQNTIKSTTYYNIELMVNKHIKSFFDKNLLISELYTSNIYAWKEHINKECKTKRHQNKILGYFQEILQYAVDNYDFNKKIANKLQKYRLEKTHKQINDALMNYWTYDQFYIFINYVKEKDKLYYILFNFLYFTGVRFGEMVALTWKDIDLERKTIKINKTLVTKIKGKKYDILDPKTENSNRIIDMDDDLVYLLKKHKEHESKIYSFNDNMFVFGNIKYVSATTFRRKLIKYINEVNKTINDIDKKLKIITPHGFRHSHVSFLIDLGLDVRDVAERIGDTIEVIEKTYYHMFPSKKSKTVNAINKHNLSRNLSR